jgi:NADH-quinone oxidoreductase subunit N
MTPADAIYLLPEIILTIGASLLLIAPVVGMRGDVSIAKWWILALLAITAGAVIYSSHAVEQLEQTNLFAAMFALDGFAIFFKLLVLAVMGFVVLLSTDFLRENRYSPWEFFALLSFALCGIFFMVSGVHLVSIYVGLELMSLSSYILAGYYKNETKSTEAAMKYFVLGAVSSAILLYGMSLVFGVCESLRLVVIRDVLATMVQNDALLVGVLMVAAGLCFKIAAAPFHVWTPDVYVGAPTPITAFLSTASKIAALAIFARIFYWGFSSFNIDWSTVLAAVAALSMFVGNVAALTQTNLKRLIAYSSIAHAGYALMGIVATSELGLRGILVYSVVYAFSTLGIWAVVMVLRGEEYAGESLSDFDGLHRRSPMSAFAMLVFLLSLGGIPPTAGFIGKYYLFAAAVQSGFGWLAIIAVLMSAVSMFYYLKVVVAMYLKEGKGAVVAAPGAMRLATALCLVLTIALGLAPEVLLRGVRASLPPFVRIVASK